MTATTPSPEAPCPCGGSTWGSCCGPIVAGTQAAATAEALMRSRYSAFVVGDVDHLVRSWHPDTVPTELRIVPGQHWTGLQVLTTERGRALDATGLVEFRASYLRGGRPGALHEVSRFQRVEGRWVYLDGEVE